MSINWTIRPYESEDRDALVLLWQICGLTRPWNDPVRDINFASANSNSRILLALHKDRIAASVMVGHDGHRGWIYYLAVLPELQEQGLGSAMTTAAEDWLKSLGVWKLQLMVRAENSAVVDFYEKLGFRELNVRCLQKTFE